jgi:ABC-type multidrug transport system fused ATPase/permease subunit
MTCSPYHQNLPIFLCLLAEGIKVVSDWWLSAWTGDLYAQSITFYLVVYGALGVGQVVLTLIATLCLAFVSQRAALFMHDRAFRNLMRAPLSFFDTTPIGRILNRFSRDQVRFGMKNAKYYLFLRRLAFVSGPLLHCAIHSTNNQSH